jgi:glycosyltransferase involved in cell wall biosynthesis
VIPVSLLKCALLVLRRVGPYHHSRILAVAGRISIHVLETRHRSCEYPWDPRLHNGYPVYRLHGHDDPESDLSCDDLDRQLTELLSSINPGVVVSVGWADRAYQRLLLACKRLQIPVVIVSDSRERDQPRFAVMEWIKRQLLLGYSAALVAGVESRVYLESLGFPAVAISQPWDVVDNDFFALAANQFSLQSYHFLCVSRLVAKKNHQGLLEAYGGYQRQGGRWGLRLVGSGPLQQAIKSCIARLPDPSKVELRPFCQLEDLSRLYGQASAFILASTTDQWGLVVNEAMAAGLPCLVSRACGCAVELVDHSVTGWCFDPAMPERLTALMHDVEQQNLQDRVSMVAAARERLDSFSLETFSAGLELALQWAHRYPRFSRRAALTAQLLSRLH